MTRNSVPSAEMIDTIRPSFGVAEKNSFTLFFEPLGTPLIGAGILVCTLTWTAFSACPLLTLTLLESPVDSLVKVVPDVLLLKALREQKVGLLAPGPG